MSGSDRSGKLFTFHPYPGHRRRTESGTRLQNLRAHSSEGLPSAWRYLLKVPEPLQTAPPTGHGGSGHGGHVPFKLRSLVTAALEHSVDFTDVVGRSKHS